VNRYGTVYPQRAHHNREEMGFVYTYPVALKWNPWQRGRGTVLLCIKEKGIKILNFLIGHLEVNCSRLTLVFSVLSGEFTVENAAAVAKTARRLL
jgi:hypothetical protein